MLSFNTSSSGTPLNSEPREKFLIKPPIKPPTIQVSMLRPTVKSLLTHSSLLRFGDLIQLLLTRTLNSTGTVFMELISQLVPSVILLNTTITSKSTDTTLEVCCQLILQSTLPSELIPQPKPLMRVKFHHTTLSHRLGTPINPPTSCQLSDQSHQASLVKCIAQKEFQRLISLWLPIGIVPTLSGLVLHITLHQLNKVPSEIPQRTTTKMLS